MAQKPVEQVSSVILDPSLLTMAGSELLSGLLAEKKLEFTITPAMQDVLKDAKLLSGIMTQWGESPGHLSFVNEFVMRAEVPYRLKLRDVRADIGEFVKKGLRPTVRYNIADNENIIGFICDEMALALGSGIPILCVVSSPEWKIIEFFRRIGSQVKKTTITQLNEKRAFLKTDDFKKLAIASGLSAAVVYVLGGLAAMAVPLATSSIYVVVYADP